MSKQATAHVTYYVTDYEFAIDPESNEVLELDECTIVGDYHAVMRVSQALVSAGYQMQHGERSSGPVDDEWFLMWPDRSRIEKNLRYLPKRS